MLHELATSPEVVSSPAPLDGEAPRHASTEPPVPADAPVRVDSQLLAEVHADWEDFGEAIGCWQRAVALQPEDAAVHLGLGAALRETGGCAEAEEQVSP